MDQKTFLDALEQRLVSMNVRAVDEIIEDYQDHFRGKLADGYTEAEIAARLGDPLDLAAQYEAQPGNPAGRDHTRLWKFCGLVLLDILAGLMLLTFWIWIIALGLITVGLLVLAVAVAANAGISAVIPFIPTAGALLLALSLAALSVLAGFGTLYSCKLSVSATRSYRRFHQRVLTRKGQPKPPSRSAAPVSSPRFRRITRRIIGITSFIFGISFMAGFAVLALSAKSWEFWHVWGWFV